MSNPSRRLHAVPAESLATPDPWAAGAERPAWPSDSAFVAVCSDPRHPTLLGRVKVVWQSASGSAHGAGCREWWVPSLHGLSIRAGDRLLLQHALGSSEPIVIGVIDGFMPRPELESHRGPRLEIGPDETLRVHTADGQGLVEIAPDETGHVVRLLRPNTRLAVPGKLSISADELELKAASGSVRIEASDDVRLVGEVVHLN